MDINVDKRWFPSREDRMVDCRSEEHRWPFDSALYMNEEWINVTEDAMQSTSGQGLKFVMQGKKAWCFKGDATHELIRRASGGRECSPSIRPWWLASSLLKIWRGRIRLIWDLSCIEEGHRRDGWCGRATYECGERLRVAPTRLISPRHESVT